MIVPRQRLTRSRFYAILDAAYVPAGRWTDTCRSLIEGGADVVQIRAKQDSAAQRATRTEAVLDLFLDSGGTPRPGAPLLIINDDLELAASLPGAGLHIGQSDTPATAARDRLGPDRILGLSTHSFEQARNAWRLPSGILDYFAVGPVFPTPTKPDYPAVGIELVRTVANAHPPVPFFCIGGITRSNIDQVIEAGAERIVVVSDVLCDPDPAAAVRELRTRLDAPSP